MSSKIRPIKFVRKPFVVEAVQVTQQNMRDLSRWCRGRIHTVDAGTVGGTPGTKVKCINVPVKRPLSERQTQALVGDWVVTQGSGHKVYTPKAFAGSFDRVDEKVEVPEVEKEPKLETIQVTPSDLYERPEPQSA